MRKAAFASLVLLLSGVAAFGQGTPIAANPSQLGPRTMDEALDRVITNENRMYGNIKNYSPLVETYIQNLKPDKDLGYVPGGDKYFLGRADFQKGVALVSLSDTDSKGKDRKSVV